MFWRKTGVRRFTLLAALAATILVVISTIPHGIGVSTDSIRYISVARNLSAGDGFTTFDAAPLTLHPPLFPAILSFLNLLFGIDPFEGARFLNAAVFGLIVCLSRLLFERPPEAGLNLPRHTWSGSNVRTDPICTDSVN